MDLPDGSQHGLVDWQGKVPLDHLDAGAPRIFSTSRDSTIRSDGPACYTASRMHERLELIHPRAREGIRLFNQGRYFEAHEELEVAWREEPGKMRELYQGMLEAGVTLLHLGRGNLTGALKVYDRSMRWLKDWPEVCGGAHIGKLRRDLQAAVEEASRLGPDRLAEINPSLLKPILVFEET
jgi:predicted metal-dependent hydrolase